MKKILILTFILIFIFNFSFAFKYNLDMILVETYNFQIGNSCIDCNPNFPLAMHYVDFTYNFYISKYETSRNLFMKFVEDTGYDFSFDQNNYFTENHLDNPIYGVSWMDALNFCNWFSEKNEFPKSYDPKGNLLNKFGEITENPKEVVGFRLPTDSEWEMAATGGLFNTFSTYSGSDDIEKVCWYLKNSDSKIHPSGSLNDNELGLFDMSGNLWEWTTDSFYMVNFYGSSVTDPYYNLGNNKIIRGGSSNTVYEYCKPFYRFEKNYMERDNYIGFRIVITAK